MDQADRDKLTQEKIDTDARIRELKQALRAARTRAATHGRYMPAAQYHKLQNELAILQRRSQELQALLKRAPRKAQLTFPRVFMSVAEELLPERQFHHLLHIALARHEEDKN